MPNPTANAVHIDRPLTNIAVAYSQTGNFIARDVFPIVPVQKQSDQYWKYNKADWLRSQAQRRAPGTESAGAGWTLATDNYRCDVYAIHKDIHAEQLANQDAPINLQRDAARFVTRQLLMKQETDWRDTFFKTGVWDTDVTGGLSTDYGTNTVLKWNDAASDPIYDCDHYQDLVNSRTGYRPNVGVAGTLTARALRNNADIIDRVKYTQRGVVTNELIAAVLNLDSYVIPTGIIDTSVEGSGTESPGYIFSDDDFLMLYRTNSPSLFEPSAGYTFMWTAFLGSRDGMRIKRFPMIELNSERVEGETVFDQKVVATDVAVMFNDIAD